MPNVLSQVIEERDRADAQARLATVGRREAEAARAMADERADQLMIARARALLDSNPTAVLASLKQLSLTDVQEQTHYQRTQVYGPAPVGVFDVATWSVFAFSSISVTFASYGVITTSAMST